MRDVQNRFFFILVRLKKKNSNFVWNDFGSVQFEKCGLIWIL